MAIKYFIVIPLLIFGGSIVEQRDSQKRIALNMGSLHSDYFAFFALEPNINVTTIAVGVEDIQHYCSLYWYGEPTK